MQTQTGTANRSHRFQDVLEPFVTNGGLPGAVAVAADKDGLLGAATVGFADIATRQPMQMDTLFWIASQTKPMTATALMMLVEEGSVRLDDPVEHYLPLLKDPWVVAEQDDMHLLLHKAERSVTVRDLMRHTSGMPFKSAMEEPTLDGLPLATTVQSYAMTPLQSQPGSRYAYSNTGINTAGRIIEVVSGMPFETFLQKRLLDPLGMTDTTFWPTTEQLNRLAKVYRPNAERTALEESRISQLRYPLDGPARYAIPGGGLFSTAPDVVRFCRMILRGGTDENRRYLSPASIAEMTRRQTEEPLAESYGLGWAVGTDDYGHAGAQATQMNIHPSQGRITVYLVQLDGTLFDADKAHGAFVAAALEA